MNLHTVAESDREQLENEILVTPSKNPTPVSPRSTLGELLQSAPILGRKRARDIEPHIGRDIFAEETAAILQSSTKVKEKFNLDGEFLMIKSRMVSGGNGQNIEDIPESLRSAPTTATSSVNTIASIAAARGMEVATVDVLKRRHGWRRIHVDSGTSTMRKRQIILTYLHTNNKGQRRVLVKVLKAQYGCVESGRLWYEHIAKALTEQGFNINPFDKCIFQRKTGDSWTYITLYVDDLMIASDEVNLVDEVISKLTEKYKDLTVHRGKVHDYLGMMFDFTKEGEVFISMEAYITEILKGSNITDTADTPASTDLFDIEEHSPPLSNKDREIFHRKVAQCLYAVTRKRPDASLPVIFLTTRVLTPTKQDQTKLDRVLRYFNGTKEMGIFFGLSEENDLRIVCYADVSHDTHYNGKSHTGVVISHGRGAILAKSMKQKIVFRSSTEYELVALSDATSLAAYELQFMESLGMDVKKAHLYQDNTSTIRIAFNGKSCSDRTKHIKLRYFFVKQYIDSGEFEVTHCPTAMMTADILTKPLQGKHFKTLRDKLLGYK